MREAVIVAGARTAVGKARRGITANARADDMAATVIRELMRQTEDKLDPADIDDVIVGCAMPEGAQGLNTARSIAMLAGLPVDVPGMTVNRFCSSGLQTIAMGAERIIANGADAIIAGGAETMSLVPMRGFHMSPNPTLAREMPEVYIGMGATAEQVADEFDVNREDMDEFAYHSQRKAAAATDAGYFAEEIVPFEWGETVVGEDQRPQTKQLSLREDEHLRRGTTMEGWRNSSLSFGRVGALRRGIRARSAMVLPLSC